MWEPSAGLQTLSTPYTPFTREDFLNWGPVTRSSSLSLPPPWWMQKNLLATLAPSVWTSERKGLEKKKKEAMGQWMDKQMGWRAWGLLNIHWLGGKKWSYRQKRKWRSGSSVFAWADALKDGRTGVWKIYMGEEYCKRIVDLPFLLSRLRESKTSR